MKISVLVLTYRSELSKVCLTLKSILEQQADDFEIVVTDDGSAENHESELKAFFEQNHFINYKLVMNEQNQGTVRNILSGLAACSGEYVKPISGGDLLYGENTLSDLYHFMKEQKLDYCHGLVRGYRMEGQQVIPVGYSHPFDIQAYRKKDHKRITKNLVLYSDNTCGAAICYEHAFLDEYMNRIKEVVRLEEDIFQVLAAVENKKVALFDQYMVWYEIGGGVSTKKHKPSEDPLAQDVDRLYRKLYEWHPENKFVKQRFRLLPFYNIKNLYVRTLLRMFVNPDSVRYLISSFLQRAKGAHRCVGESKGFLDDKRFLDEYFDDGFLVHTEGL